MIELTENAISAIRTAISGSTVPVEGLRIMVEPGGCAGNKYMLGLVAGGEPNDVIVERNGLKLFVDAGSVPLLHGVTVDYLSGLEGSGFTFENPNATTSCSCGKSFC